MRKTSSVLIGIVAVLICIGIVMLASTSSVKGAATFDDAHYFVKRQLVWLVVGCLLGLLIVRVDYHWWRKLVVPIGIVSVILLCLVLIPHVGSRVGGSSRWLRLGPFSLQPSEMAKFFAIIGMAAWMSMMGWRCRRFKEGLLIPFAGLGCVCGLLILEPDFGAALLTGLVGMIVMFAAGTRIGYLVIAGALASGGFAAAVMRDPLRMGRVLAFLMPDKYPATAYHLRQSKIAFIRGGWQGVGLGNSLQKQFYLPEAHNDFILAIVGEELGFVGTAAILLLFVGLLVCGMLISLRAPDPFGRLLAFGFTMMLSLQAAINIGVVTGCLPTKGLPLPFISYGGSSLVVCIAGVCVLLNIAAHCTRERVDEHTRPIRDVAHRL